jgi:hypothetical protein
MLWQRQQSSRGCWSIAAAAAYLTIALCFVVIGAAPTFKSACPGLVGSSCSTDCQLHLCLRLAALYRVSNNISDPWCAMSCYTHATTLCRHHICWRSLLHMTQQQVPKGARCSGQQCPAPSPTMGLSPSAANRAPQG